MITLEIVIAVVGVALAVSLLKISRRLSVAVEEIDSRFGQLSAGVALLTDTTEVGLRDLAVEIGRQAQATAAVPPAVRSARQRRVTGAARKGRSVQEIAAHEAMSEGEVRLRLNLDDARKDRANASMR